jgi:hypothetical protein
LYDWSLCKPGHRQSTNNIVQLPDDKFAVCIPGEPVVWIFSRKPPLVDPSSVSPTGIVAPLPNQWSPRPASKRVGRSAAGEVCEWPEGDGAGNAGQGDRRSSAPYGTVYLVEIQYFLRLKTGQAPFVPMPRHLYGELARSAEGCAVLVKRNLIHNLIRLVRSSKSHSSSSELRAALWSLGHIASSEFGFNIVIGIDYYFIDFCVERVLSCSNYSMRGTYFYILGLISRSKRGCARLQKLKWYSVSHCTSAAVALPRNPSILFRSVQLLPSNSATPRTPSESVHADAPPSFDASSSSSGGAVNVYPTRSTHVANARNPSIQAAGRTAASTATAAAVSGLDKHSQEVLAIISMVSRYSNHSVKGSPLILFHR